MRADPPGLLIFGSVATTYLALAQFAMWLNDPVHLGAGFWPAAGVTTAALLLLPIRRWGWVVGAVVLAELGGDLARGYAVAASLWWTVGNVAGPVMGAALVRRFAHPRGELAPLRSLVGFLAFGVVVGPLVGATLGSIGSIAVMGNPVWQVWPKYVVGDALGVLVVAPLLLTWHEPRRRRHRLESSALRVLLFVLPILAFRNWNGSWDVAFPYLLTPLLTWAALRYGMRGAACSVLWVAQVANWATASGYGPFALAGAENGHAVTLLQLFVGIAAVSALILAAIVDDLSDRDQVEHTLRHQAQHDPLTGLPNRSLLDAHLEAALARQGGRSGGVVLLVCDLDDFKDINDGLGHQAGDQVLVEVARRLKATVRSDDVVVRLGGDEFVIVLEDATDQAVRSLTDRLLAVVPDPVLLDNGQRVAVGLSIGVAASAPRHDAEALLRDADATLYRAKDRGRGRAEHFDSELRLEVLERLALPQELRAAFTRRELFCLHQPEIDLLTGKLFGFEALVRWDHPRRGLLTPDRFVPVAETAGLAGALFDTVLRETLVAQQRWATPLGFRPAVSVNLSPRQLDDPTLPAAVAMALTRTGTPPDLLWLEVTETAIAESGSFATLTALHELGVHLAIDDFGTGWSSLARLSDFPWDLLKIDRSFIAKLARGNQTEHVVRATIVMAHALGMRTVAEGVETLDQLEILRSMECDIAQGYLFSVPIESQRATADIAADGTWTGPGQILRPRQSRK